LFFSLVVDVPIAEALQRHFVQFGKVVHIDQKKDVNIDKKKKKEKKRDLIVIFKGFRFCCNGLDRSCRACVCACATFRMHHFAFIFLLQISLNRCVFKIGNIRVTVRKAKPKTQKQKNSKALLLGFTVAVNQSMRL
jgi:hypothetical protein